MGRNRRFRKQQVPGIKPTDSYDKHLLNYRDKLQRDLAKYNFLISFFLNTLRGKCFTFTLFTDRTSHLSDDLFFVTEKYI